MDNVCLAIRLHRNNIDLGKKKIKTILKKNDVNNLNDVNKLNDNDIYHLLLL